MKPPHHIRIGTPGAPKVAFGHGWDRSHRDFIPVAEALAPLIDAYLFDLPGFGKTERPDDAWGTVEYADYMARHMVDQLGFDLCTWVGHSLGGRIGLRLGRRSGGLIERLVIVAGAGVPRSRSRWEQFKGKRRSARFQRLKAQAKDEATLIALEKKFGSPDYVHSRETGMRDIFTATVTEDQTAELPRITMPTTLIYGADDVDTPPEVGRKIASLVPAASYVEVPFCDHISILDRGRHQIALAIKEGLPKGAPTASDLPGAGTTERGR
ncbi:alpha/beta fold hydrolase [Croceicoccus sp. Ery5]|uniref:alpha/beta fold hydrolase n=1 Tax=Croceicoccus sp. Ery5 TaxID=1703340 RepID=UPI001E400E30|nr:alpha/beta hydrolase [Croceicoccus sp. Ery5]